MSADVVTVFSAPQQVAWLPWAVQYFFLIGLSVGAFLLSLPGIVFRRARWRGISRRALLGALLCAVTAPLALLSDLHQPGRFLNFYAHSNWSSWMAWGAFFIPIYVGGLLLYAWIALRPALAAMAEQGGRGAAAYARLAYGGDESRAALAVAALLAGVGALLVLLYTGMEVSAPASRPLWHTPIVPALFALSALAGAIGMVHLLDRSLGCATQDATRTLNRLLLATQVLVVAASLLWTWLDRRLWAELWALAPWRLSAFWTAAAALLLLWLAWKRPARGLLAGLLALASAWLLRWDILIGGQGLSKLGEGYAPYATPIGYDGVLGMAGTAGLWLALYLALTAALPWGARPAAHGAPS